ncbi:hypothetical protein BW99_09515 [Escherichia coli O157:H7 str. 08-3527]|uniref:Uncharacterized protein n=2 Tax=Traversvirus TaxID=1981157 RepID=Q7Y2R7_9CAUD|nr:hypothetical protein Stx1_p065 [Escherichia Stx1 converting phage]NP_859309.1 hypothetical protein Stx2II_p064 [Escherichia phage Stx2 II]EYU72152.1 hypothetical protein BX62_03275 [Escherichia coli O121:H19 str. 2010C-4254]EYV03092.1 hypothetical protein BX54_00470 [Escherichia coli O121:H19 str. 2010C-3840]EYV03631.1 hypothetical protein BX52_03135 [Escherichia coli O121:H19 str. 2010C-3609]EYV63382.1 hypothetical protein BX36_12420 [Escherichia coli O157:H7 str. 2009EL2109]EYV73626.1 hy
MEFDVVRFAVLFGGEVPVCHHCHRYRAFDNFANGFTSFLVLALCNRPHGIRSVIGEYLPVILVGIILHQFQEGVTHFVFAMADQRFAQVLYRLSGRRLCPGCTPHGLPAFTSADGEALTCTGQ